jgi:hypothetical protein
MGGRDFLLLSLSSQILSHSLCLIYHPWAFCYSWRGCFIGRVGDREGAKEG